MPVFLEQFGVAYFAIPKIASTSIKRALFEVETGEPYVRLKEHKNGVHSIYPTHHTTKADWKHAEPMWKFAVFRDPVKRILSAYTNRVADHRDLRKAPNARWKSRLLRISLDPDMEEFVTYLPRYMMLSGVVRHHLEGYANFVGSDLSRLDAVYRQEELAPLETELAERIGRPVPLPRFQTSTAKSGFADLAPRAQRALLRFTAPDYALMNGMYEPPQAN